MNADERELNIARRWPISSKMHERYDRIVCADDLLLRNTIARRIGDGWSLAPAFFLRQSAGPPQRIDKSPPPSHAGGIGTTDACRR